MFPIQLHTTCPLCREIHLEEGSALPCFARWIWGATGPALAAVDVLPLSPAFRSVLNAWEATGDGGRLVWVCGSRDLTLQPEFELRVFYDVLQRLEVAAVAHGGASGIDAQAGTVAEVMGLPEVVIRPEWARLGKRAGHVRNGHLGRLTAAFGGTCVAVYAGNSPTPGTASALRCAAELGVRRLEVQVRGVTGIRVLRDRP